MTASIYVYHTNPSCLLPLPEALQNQQVGLTQATFKLLLLMWVSECVSCCVYPLGVESLSLTTFWLSWKQALLAFKAKCSGGLCSHCRTPGLGCPLWDLDPSFLGENSAIVVILLFVGFPPRGTPILQLHPSYLSRCGSFFTSLVV